MPVIGWLLLASAIVVILALEFAPDEAYKTRDGNFRWWFLAVLGLLVAILVLMLMLSEMR
jgi:hypothetical protein